MQKKNVAAVGLTLLLAACGNPEKDCREGIERMTLRTRSAVGVGTEGAAQLEQSKDLIRQAREQARQADYAGCVESIANSGAMLNRSQRN